MLYKFFWVCILTLLFCLDAFAKTPESVMFFNDKPRSLAKDFYIQSYLQREETTPKEAKILFGMVHTMNIRLFHIYKKKMDKKKENKKIQELHFQKLNKNFTNKDMKIRNKNVKIVKQE